jgi:hypothetical protein
MVVQVACSVPVARMQAGGRNPGSHSLHPLPDFATLHPGYDITAPSNGAMGSGLTSGYSFYRCSPLDPIPSNHTPCIDMIFLTVGDLDIPAHIPSHLRTL